MLSDKLKEQTKTSHQTLEKALVSQIKAVSSTQQYVKLLTLFYGYFGGLEFQINQAIDNTLLPDNEKRRKTQAIADDIRSLGGEPAIKATGKALPRIQNHLEALGALYVIEGSTLGGKIISKMMQQQLALNKGLSFFSGYGENTDNMWNSFKDALNEQAQSPEQEAVVIAAANETFSKFGEWFNNVK